MDSCLGAHAQRWTGLTPEESSDGTKSNLSDMIARHLIVTELGSASLGDGAGSELRREDLTNKPQLSGIAARWMVRKRVKENNLYEKFCVT